MVEIRHLRVLVAAIEQGSIQAASRLLNIAQPALTRRIQDLETELGCELLVRGVRGVTPTPAGKALYHDAQAIIQALAEATQQAQRLGLDQRSEVRLGLIQTARKYGFVRDAIASFNEQYSGAGVALTRGLSRDLVAALRNGNIDLTLLYERHAGAEGFAERLIHRERYILAVHPSHHLAMDAPARLLDLVGEPMVCVLRHDEVDQHNPILQHCRLHGLEPVVGQWADTPDEMMDMVAIGTGLCVTPASTILSTPPGHLVFRALPEFALRLDLHVAWRVQHASHFAGALLREIHSAIDLHHEAIRNPDTSWWARLHGMSLFETS